MLDKFINDYFILVVFICLILHIVVGIFLNKTYYRKENKNTPMAFIPLANIYLIGSLAIHNFIGWILIILTVLNINYPVVIDNKIIIKRILPENLNGTISFVIIASSILLLLILLFKKMPKHNKQVDSDRFLTEAELMKDPATLKRNYNNFEKKESNLFQESKLDNINKQPSLNIPQPRMNNNQSMPNSFNSQPTFNNQNQIPSKNPFNRRGLK